MLWFSNDRVLTISRLLFRPSSQGPGLDVRRIRRHYDSDQAVGATLKDFTVFVDGVEVVEAEEPVEALLMWLICQFVFSSSTRGPK